MKNFEIRIRNGGDDAVEAVREYLDKRQDILNDITDAFAKQRWIPVGERLPDGREEVLGWQSWVPNQHWCAGVFVCRRIDRDTAYLKAGEWLTEEGRLWNVTHWMPLPEPPKRIY
jgi:hypothetical protein